MKTATHIIKYKDYINIEIYAFCLFPGKFREGDYMCITFRRQSTYNLLNKTLYKKFCISYMCDKVHYKLKEEVYKRLNGVDGFIRDNKLNVKQSIYF